MRIHYRVQHAAGRDAALERLLTKLPPAVEVITDHEAVSDPNPMRNYLRCLDNIPSGPTHLCVLQDDALPCAGFGLKLNEAVKERPDDLISLFVGGLPGKTTKMFREAMVRGDRWSLVWWQKVVHVVALCWPVPLAREFLEWFPTAHVPGPQPPRSDDAVVGFWARTRKPRLEVWATVPCLVEHPDDVPSVAQDEYRVLGDSGRKAVWFADS